MTGDQLLNKFIKQVENIYNDSSISLKEKRTRFKNGLINLIKVCLDLERGCK